MLAPTILSNHHSHPVKQKYCQSDLLSQVDRVEESRTQKTHTHTPFAISTNESSDSFFAPLTLKSVDVSPCLISFLSLTYLQAACSSSKARVFSARVWIREFLYSRFHLMVVICSAGVVMFVKQTCFLCHRAYASVFRERTYQEQWKFHFCN